MTEQESGQERKRAWVFIQAEDPVLAVMKGLHDELGEKGGDCYVVVRADIVEFEPYNAIVPVDAWSEDALKRVLGLIEDHPGVIQARVVEVLDHVPEPPHNANGYITVDEAIHGDDRDVVPGRQGASPGFNAWG